MLNRLAVRIVLSAVFLLCVLSPDRTMDLQRDSNSTDNHEGCTIGVAAGSVTADGRPLLWKIRDNSDLPNNSILFDTSFVYRFIGVTNSGSHEVWMGVNERGFAIVNSTAHDLPGGSTGFTNGLLMQYALGTCASLDDFEHLLDSTDATGRRTQANFGVIDASGGAIMFEVAASSHWKYDARTTLGRPEGCILRTNFAMNGGGRTGIERYRRALVQIDRFHAGDSLDYKRIIRYHARDFSDASSNPISIPFTQSLSSTTPIGYINSAFSICRSKSVSAVAIVGVLPHERPSLSTMWTILGQPAAGIAVPYWPVGDPPQVVMGDSTSPLHELATRIKSLLFSSLTSSDLIDTYKLRDESGNGLWAWTFPAEDSITDAAEQLLAGWRRSPPDKREMLHAEHSLATYGYSVLRSAYDKLTRRIVIRIANGSPIIDERRDVLQPGDVVQLIWAGADRRIEPPCLGGSPTGRGMPDGDDRLIGWLHRVGENFSSSGMFRFQMTSWFDDSTGLPAIGDLVYVRAFNDSSLTTASYYGDSQPYAITVDGDRSYTPFIRGGRTSQPMRPVGATPKPLAEVSLSAGFPNPFNSSTIIEYSVPQSQSSRGEYELTVFNGLGQTVKRLVSGMSSDGKHQVTWDGKDEHGVVQSSGVYYVCLKTSSALKTGKLLLLK